MDKPDHIKNLGNVNNYSTILNKMTPEEYEAHLEERRLRKLKKMEEKSRKQAFEEVLNAQKAQWIAEANNAMVAQMKEAKLGNTAAFNAVMSYLIGKPDSQVDITSNGNTVMQAPTIIFTPKTMDDWKDDQDEG